jgi:hypothetical protein
MNTILHQFLPVSIFFSLVGRAHITTLSAGFPETILREKCGLSSFNPEWVPNCLKIIKLYNSLMPIDYLRKFIADIDGSVLHVRIVTDTCTYGTDIPALARVVILHLGDSIDNSQESRKQQMGPRVVMEVQLSLSCTRRPGCEIYPNHRLRQSRDSRTSNGDNSFQP